MLVSFAPGVVKFWYVFLHVFTQTFHLGGRVVHDVCVSYYFFKHTAKLSTFTRTDTIREPYKTTLHPELLQVCTVCTSSMHAVVEITFDIC